MAATNLTPPPMEGAGCRGHPHKHGCGRAAGSPAFFVAASAPSCWKSVLVPSYALSMSFFRGGHTFLFILPVVLTVLYKAKWSSQILNRNRRKWVIRKRGGGIWGSNMCVCVLHLAEMEKRCLQELLPLARSICKHDHCKYSLKLRITRLESYKLHRSRVACPVAIPASPSGSPKCGHHSCPRRSLLCAVWFCTTTQQTTQKHGIPGIDTADANLVKSQGTKCMPWCSQLNHLVKQPVRENQLETRSYKQGKKHH